MNPSNSRTEIAINLGDRSYGIVVGCGLLDETGAFVRRAGFHSPIPVITDSNVGPIYAERVRTSLEREGFHAAVLTFPAGETEKNISTLSRLYDGMAALKPERKSGVVALGGGVVGDVAGFAAATFLRGIRFIQVPTTLLAQVDASVGGKVGIDHASGKNLIGAFHQPSAVLIDPQTLLTLDRRQIKAGLAEIVKHGVIADAGLFETVSSALDRLLAAEEEIYTAIIPWNCRIKARVVEQDERESGLRAILNFGHTIGHAVEALTGYGRYLHGEAVAIGMLAEAMLGEKLGITPPEAVQRLRSLLTTAGFPLSKPDLSADALLESMFHDKKVERGHLRFVFPVEIGNVVIRSVEDLDLIRNTWDSYSI
ncbi:MAG: 3-dehydroquinate synthase [Candidatus Omnitrophota bacterium]